MKVEKSFELETLDKDDQENSEQGKGKVHQLRVTTKISHAVNTRDMFSQSEDHLDEEKEDLIKKVRVLESKLEEERIKRTDQHQRVENSFQVVILLRFTSVFNHVFSRLESFQRHLERISIFGRRIQSILIKSDTVLFQKIYIVIHSVLCGYLFLVNFGVAIWFASYILNLVASMTFACWHIYIAVFLQKDGRPNLWKSEIIRLLLICVVDLVFGVTYMSSYTPMFGICILISLTFSVVVMFGNIDKKELYEAIKRGDIEYVRSSFETGMFKADERLYFNRSLLHLAAFYGQTEVAKYLILNGAQVDALDMDDATPLYLASDRGHAKVVSLLLERGANANHKQETGMTALHVATHNGYLDVVRCLVDVMPNLNVTENDNWTALHYAAKKGHYEIVKLLLDKGADANLQQQGGCTPLYLAVNNGHEDTASLLIQRKAKVNIANSDGNTPLIISLRDKNSLEICKMLLEAKADVNAKNKFDWTPLHLASRGGNIEVVNLLLSARANVNAPKRDGWTPLHLAARNGHLSVVEMLVNHDADVTLKTNNGKTAVELAKCAKLAMNKDTKNKIIEALSNQIR